MVHDHIYFIGYLLGIVDNLSRVVNERRYDVGHANLEVKSGAFDSGRNRIKPSADSFESQAFRASGLNLVVSAIVHWNTVYLGRAVDHPRRQGRIIPAEVLKHVSTLGGEHINLTGTYAWGEHPVLVDGFCPLRLPQPLARTA